MKSHPRIMKGKGPTGLIAARLRILDSLLSDGRWHTSTDLHASINQRLRMIDDSLSISVRQVQNDLVTIEDICFRDFPDATEIYEYKGCRGRSARRYLPGISLFAKRLSKNEKILLGSLLPLTGNLSGEETLRQIECLKQEALSGRLPSDIIDMGIRIPEGDIFANAFTAITDKQPVRLKYHTFRKPNSRMTEIFPEMLRQYNGRWFLMGRVLSDGFAVTFRLDQIDELSSLPESRLEQSGIDTSRNYYSGTKTRHLVGVTFPSPSFCENLDQIVFWIDDQSYPYFITNPFPGEEMYDEIADDTYLRERYPHLKGGRFMTIYCGINHEIKQKFMSYMDSITVVEPEWLAADMRERVRKMNRNYNPE